jgi:hypothetical protein
MDDTVIPTGRDHHMNHSVEQVLQSSVKRWLPIEAQSNTLDLNSKHLHRHDHGIRPEPNAQLSLLGVYLAITNRIWTDSFTIWTRITNIRTNANDDNGESDLHRVQARSWYSDRRESIIPTGHYEAKRTFLSEISPNRVGFLHHEPDSGVPTRIWSNNA